MSRRGALEWLLAGRAEIAVLSARPNHGEVEYQPFLEDQVVLIVPADHPWADGRTVTPEDLRAEPFILREATAGTHEVLAEGLPAHGLAISQLQSVLTLANAEAIEMSVEAGIGIAFVSRMAAVRGSAGACGGGSGAGHGIAAHNLYRPSSAACDHAVATGLLGIRLRSCQ